MPHFYADVHCHSTAKPFFTQKGGANGRLDIFKSAPNNINSWLLSRLKKVIEKASEIKLSTQSNFDALFEGGHRVVVVALTPPEKGFFVINQHDDNFIDDFLKTLVSVQEVPFTGTIRESVVNALTGFSTEDIQFCKFTATHYYNHLLKPEYEFLKSFNGKQGKGGYTMRIVKSFTEIETALTNDPNTLCIVISVEGAHSFHHIPGFLDLLQNQTTTHKNDQDNFTGLQDYENNIEDIKRWEHPPFFITFNHHQWNGLGGHARSMNKLMTKLINQEEGINLGINALGKQVIKRLLSNTNGKRILIDIKHMSPRSRRDYYDLLASPEIPGGDTIPIICSHCGVVTKRTTLVEMIDLADNHDWQELDTSDNYLHECSINLCAEDVLKIFASKGLMGIQLDEKRIAGKGIIKIIQKKEGVQVEEVNRQYASVVVANLLRVVQIVNKPEAWDILCIGSDFDGLINHLDCCSSSIEIPKLESFMLDVLNNGTDIKQDGFNYSISAAEIWRLLFGLTPEEAMEKVFYKNVEAFLKANFK